MRAMIWGRVLAAGLFSLAAAEYSAADTISLSGNLPDDSSVALYNFDVETQSIFGSNHFSFYTNGSSGAPCTLGTILLSVSAVYGSNYLPADGRLLSIQSNVELFSLLGTNYGGDGITTFGLPDLRAAAPNNTQYLICTLGTYP